MTAVPNQISKLYCAALVAALAGCGAAATRSKQNSAAIASANTGGSSALPESGNAQPRSAPAPVQAAAPQPTDPFTRDVNPAIVANCGTTSCHGAGTTLQTVYEASSANFLKDGLMIIPAITATYAGTVLAMPPLTSHKTMSAADQQVLLNFLSQNNITIAPVSPATPTPTPTTPTTPAPTAPSVVIPVVKTCDSVSAADKATGAALTFATYNTAASNNCGGSGCHTGSGSSHNFVGSQAIAMEAGYSQQIVISIQNGSMPRGRTMSTGDKATMIDYLCGHLDF